MSAPAPGGDEPFPGVADDELVVLDQLGTVPAPTLSGLVVAPGLPEASRTRLQALGDDGGALEITEDLARAAEARVAVLSTRLPRAELTAMMGRVREAGGCPVVALAHAGGESLAVEVLRRGGIGVLAEGNEGALIAHLSGDATAGNGLLDSYDRHVARSDTTTHGRRGHDAVTGLPDRSSLEVRLATLEQEGEVPRLAHVRIVRAPLVPEELGEDAANLVRRRLSTQFLHVARAHDASLYAIGTWEFAIVGLALSPNAIQYLGRDLDRIAETYSPAGVNTLGVAVGHAGPEVSTDIAALREAAARALDVAVGDRSVVVVGADSLSLGVSATTELEAALKVVEHVERRTGRPAGSSARVGEIAAVIATALGYDGIARSRIQLAAHLHAVGQAGLPPEALRSPADLAGEALQAYQQYPVRSADYLTMSAGPDVAAAVRGHRERWDGLGFPDGLAGAEIPISARVVATAITLGELVDRPEVAAPGLDDLAADLEARAGTELDPDMVTAAVDVLDDLLGAALALAV